MADETSLLDELVEALEPFVESLGEDDDDFPDETPVIMKYGRTTYYALRMGHLRRAASAIARAEAGVGSRTTEDGHG
jgi:hypothetical protein